MAALLVAVQDGMAVEAVISEVVVDLSFIMVIQIVSYSLIDHLSQIQQLLLVVILNPLKVRL